MKGKAKVKHSPKEYPFVLTYEPHDKVYVARAVDLPGCHTEGKTPEAAVAEVYEAIAGWLETARKKRISVPAPSRFKEETRKFLLRIESQNVIKLESLATVQRKSLNTLINEAIQAL